MVIQPLGWILEKISANLRTRATRTTPSLGMKNEPNQGEIYKSHVARNA